MSSQFFAPVNAVSGRYQAPADKSISHRAAMFAAMSEGSSRIVNYLDSEDTNSTLAAVAALGADVQRNTDGSLTITGVGLGGSNGGGPKQPDQTINVGNAGTLMRLLPGWLAGQKGKEFRFDGDSSIRRRPIGRVSEPLARMGAKIIASEGGLPPFTVVGERLRGIEYQLPVASAQVKSAVLLAGLLAEGQTTIIEPEPSRDHTERMLAAAGVNVLRTENSVTVEPTDSVQLGDFSIPADFSSAAFMIAAALIVPDSELTVQQIGVNWTRTGLLSVLTEMGASFNAELEQRGDITANTERCADLQIGTTQLRGVELDPAEVPLIIDELPLLALLGCFAEGQTKVTGAQELRVKESDRISGVVEELTKLGAQIEELEDGFIVTGSGGLKGGTINSRGDHRLAMLGAVAGLASEEGVTVENFSAAAVSYPGFLNDLSALVGA